MRVTLKNTSGEVHEEYEVVLHDTYNDSSQASLRHKVKQRE